MDRYRSAVSGMLRALILAASVLLGCGQAQASGHIAAELVSEGPATPGGTATLAIHMRPEAGWHGYWLNPGDAGYAMRLAWTLPAGARVEAPLYPVPRPLLVSGLMNHVYESDYAVLVPLRLPASVPPGAVLPVQLKAEWLACSATICVPEQASLVTTLAIGTGARDSRFDGWRAQLPAPLGAAAHFALDGGQLRLAIPLPAAARLADPHLFLSEDRVIAYAARQTFSRKGDLLLIAIPRANPDPASPASLHAVLRLDEVGGVSLDATPGPVPTGGTALASDAPAPLAPLPVLLAMALAGGLLLNVMPCVFPILSLKALSLARAGESESGARAEGLAYAAGVILACLALGAALLALRAGGMELGWAFQLQQPLVVAGLLGLAVAITANLAGIYELAIPGFAAGHEQRGAFATGLLAAFVATPCTGPFMAGAMGAALLLPTGPALSLFAALGLGIALPFLAIAFVPPLRRRLPRPGGWMVWFRRLLALPMGLTALGLLWLASRLGGWNFAGAGGVFALVLLALLAMAGKRQRRGLAVAGRLLPFCAGLLLAAGVILPRAVHAPTAESPDILPSQPFSESALSRARLTGHPVFVYFTADWCLTCKLNERVAIERESTREAFARAGVTVLKGDWTRRDSAITRFLTSHGAAGVPLYLWYPARADDPRILPQILSPEIIAKLSQDKSTSDR